MMTRIVMVVVLLGWLVVIGRRMPASRWPVVILITLTLVMLIVIADQAGLWPRAWHV